MTPILDAWAKCKPIGFPNYPSGSWGLTAAEALIAQEWRSWLEPVLWEDHDGNHPQSLNETAGGDD